ncbi:ferredoxin reductase [Lysobacter fragariae]
MLERHHESADAVTLVLQPNRGWGGFRPGQHVNVGAEIDGTRITRSYSLTGIPRRDGRVAITVKATTGGKLSQHLCHTVRPGDLLDLGAAFGDMVLPDHIDAPWLFLAAGSGITPLMAMTREFAARGMPAPLTLLYWARRREELCFVDELRALADAHAGFTVHFVLTGDAAAARDEASGRIDEAHLSTLVPDLAQRRVHACGPGDFVEAARQLVLPQARSFHAEAFTPPRRRDDTADDAGTVQVALATSQRTLTLPRGESLLVALEAAGVKPASGCRMGICNTCACGKRAGSTRHLHTGELQHEPVSALRLCVNRATSDLVLEL